MACGAAMSGGIVLYVVGFEEAYWREHRFGEPHETIDVRTWMPRDPGCGKHLKRMSFSDVVVQQDGFVASVVAIVKCAMNHGRCISGPYYHLLPTPSPTPLIWWSFDQLCSNACPYWAGPHRA